MDQKHLETADPAFDYTATPEDVLDALRHATALLEALVRHVGPELARLVVCEERPVTSDLGVEVGLERYVRGLEVVSRIMQHVENATLNAGLLAHDLEKSAARSGRMAAE